MSIQNIIIPLTATIIPVNTLTATKVLFLPASSTSQGRYLLIKDAYGNASNNNIQISTTGLDLIDGVRNRYPFSTGWGTISLVADGNLAWRLSGFYQGQLTPAGPTGAALYAFTSHTFTNASATLRIGPNLAACVSAYQGTQPWVTNTAYFNMTVNGIQLWTVPATGNYTFTVAGARGGFGNTNTKYGNGAVVTLTLSLTSGHILAIAVGQTGQDTVTNGCGANGQCGGGGGGTFVYNTTTLTWLVVAGGGGGGGSQALQSTTTNASLTTSGNNGSAGANGGVGGTGGNGGTAGTGCNPATGNAGGGILTDGGASGGGTGGASYANGLTGGTGGNGVGGFGAGGSVVTFGGGGGGGYSGGGGAGIPTSCTCIDLASGGGGGTFGSVSFTSTALTNTGMGYCTVVRL
jgi:hypothetical protein